MPDEVDLLDVIKDAIEDVFTGPIATKSGDDIYLDPPVRLLAQYDQRWASIPIGGKTPSPRLNWQRNGCNASTAAMILRWFAEDCPAGRIEFPTKPNGAIDPSFYPLRMNEAFWPEATPPGKLELNRDGKVNFLKLYSVAAHYLKTGEVERRPGGNAIDRTPPKARFVSKRPAEGWMGLIRTMLEMGPVIVGIRAPSGHFVLAHGILDDSLLIADPGAILCQAYHGGKDQVEDWSGKEGYLDGTMDRDRVRMPAPSQWPGGAAPYQEGAAKCYHLISGQFLHDLLRQTVSVTSLTYPEGPKFPD